MQRRRGDAFHYGMNLQEDRFPRWVFPNAVRAISRFASQQKVERASDYRMVPCEEPEIITPKSTTAIQCPGHSFWWHRRESVRDEMTREQEITAVTELLRVQSK